MEKITVKKAEGKTLKFTIRVDGDLADVSSSTLSLVVKSDYDDTSYLIEKSHSDFDLTEAADGVVYVTLTTSDLNMTAGNYLAEIRVIFAASTNVDKSETFILFIKPSVFDD